MTDDEARAIAEEFICSTPSNGWVHQYSHCTRLERFPNEVSVIFNLSRNPNGKGVDGPVVVIVDEITNTAKYFNTT